MVLSPPQPWLKYAAIAAPREGSGRAPAPPALSGVFNVNIALAWIDLALLNVFLLQAFP